MTFIYILFLFSPLLASIWAYGAGLLESDRVENQYGAEARARRILLESARDPHAFGTFHYFKLLALYNGVEVQRIRGLYELARDLDTTRNYLLPTEPGYKACRPYGSDDYYGHCGGCDACLALMDDFYSEVPKRCFACGADFDPTKDRCVNGHSLAVSMMSYNSMCVTAIVLSEPMKTARGAQIRYPALGRTFRPGRLPEMVLIKGGK